MTRRNDDTGGVRLRGRIYWIHYRVDGERIFESTGQGDRRVALSLLAERRREIREGTWVRPGEARRQTDTTQAYLERWIARRRDEGVRGVDDEEHYLRRFAFPAIGPMPLRDVTRQHVRDLVATVRGSKNLRTGEPLSARTTLHAYRAVATAFSDSVLDGLIAATPCTLRARRGELPKKRDRDPNWRASE